MTNTTQRLRSSLLIPSLFVVVLWVIQIVQAYTPLDFRNFGVYPRMIQGIKGIFTAPLVHGGFLHLINNTFPFLVGSVIILFFYRRVAVLAFMIIYLVTGFAVWLFGKPAMHIGLSGVVYGLISFIFWSGLFRKSPKSIVLALIVAFMYSGMLYGIFPNQPGISWESHLFGSIAGALAAWIFKSFIESGEEPEYPEPEELRQSEFFLDRDTFAMTKEERKAQSQEGGYWIQDHT